MNLMELSKGAVLQLLSAWAAAETSQTQRALHRIADKDVDARAVAAADRLCSIVMGRLMDEPSIRGLDLNVNELSEVEVDIRRQIVNIVGRIARDDLGFRRALKRVIRYTVKDDAQDGSSEDGDPSERVKADGGNAKNPEEVFINGRMVTYIKLSLSVSIIFMFVISVLIIRGSGLDSAGIESDVAVIVGMILWGVTVMRATTACFVRLIFRVPDPPLTGRRDGVLLVSRQVLSRWINVLVALLLAWVAVYRGSTLVASAVVAGIYCLGWVWALGAKVIMLDPSDDAAGQVGPGRNARIRREFEILASQWLSGISTALAVGLVIFTMEAVTEPSPRHTWRLALLFAIAYLLVGSLLRAAARSNIRLWIDVDILLLWKVTRKSAALASASMGIGALLGVLTGFCIWLSSQADFDDATLDMIGRWVTSGSALGAVVGVLAVPRLAVVRRRELRQNNR
ncbi:hypothetical protein [Amycolatopsis plumensis]|uniref:Uncharacterized protein n=1 Tax=Amycolatopsis plumensis TaxID=236508 RepID=A0ABV5U4T7_9PSEU